LCLGIFLGVSAHFSVPDCWSDKIEAMPIWYRIVFFNIAMTGKRFFYYTPFMMSNGAIIACGLSYNGKDKEGNDKWDKVVAVYIMGVETADSCMTML
jgi:hypothetical protein